MYRAGPRCSNRKYKARIYTASSGASADILVAQVGNLPCRWLAAGKAAECGGIADRESAIQQTAILRYGGAPRPQSAFTMVEIAICLAIIGIALVAIIGVLPIGINVQKDNREETLIDQDAAVFMENIRNGARGAG